jgi:hypothetical protein
MNKKIENPILLFEKKIRRVLVWIQKQLAMGINLKLLNAGIH